MITLEDAISVARKVEKTANEHGHYVALAGSCLWRGHSDNDVDLIIYPHRGKESTTETTYKAIAESLKAVSVFKVCHSIPSHLVIRLQLVESFVVDLFFIHVNPTTFKTSEDLATLAKEYGP